MPEIFDCEQGSPEWFKLRAGIPTASEFSTVMAKTPKGNARGKTSVTYMRKLAGEIITGEPMEGFTNAHMERGKEMETEARDLYSFMTEIDPELIGFIRNGPKGASPDALLGDSGLLEIKTKLPHLLIELIEKDEFPPEHKAQSQGQLWVADREWIDLVAYWPKMPLFIKRAWRDEEYLKKLSGEVDSFNEDLAKMVERVRKYEART